MKEETKNEKEPCKNTAKVMYSPEMNMHHVQSADQDLRVYVHQAHPPEFLN